jgi:hypothetical protein
MTMTAGGAGYAGGPCRKRVLLEIEHTGGVEGGDAPARRSCGHSGPVRKKNQRSAERGPW